MAQLSNFWVNVLSATARAEWDTYGTIVGATDPLGDQIPLSGLNAYQRSNVPRMQSGLGRVDVAPVIFDRGEYTLPTFSVQAAGDTVTVAFTSTDAWASQVGSSMLVYASRPVNPSIVYFKGPYRFAGRINGAATPPTSPAIIALPFPCATTQKVFVRVTVSRVDGRLAPPFRGFSIAV